MEEPGRPTVDGHPAFQGHQLQRGVATKACRLHRSMVVGTPRTDDHSDRGRRRGSIARNRMMVLLVIVVVKTLVSYLHSIPPALEVLRVGEYQRERWEFSTHDGTAD